MDNLNEAVGFILVGTIAPVLFLGITGTPWAFGIWLAAVACYLISQPRSKS